MFLHSPRKALFLLGLPRSGKSTLTEFLYETLKKASFPFSISGFITKEVREKGERIGFDLIYLKDQKIVLPLARKKDFSKKGALNYPRVGKYFVFPENLEKILDLLERDLRESSQKPILFIDEIGKMESFSERFVNFLEELWKGEIKLVATLGIGEHPFLRRWQDRMPALYVEVTPENRDFLRERLLLEFTRKGFLLVLEGIDGAGKTTLFKALKEELKEDFLFSAEPTDSPYGKRLRELLKTQETSQETLLELFLKDRSEHVKNLLLPALKEGKKLLLDRYYLSTIAYQGISFQDLNRLLRLNETIAPLPDLVLYLDIPEELALKRISSRNSEKSLFEKKEILQKISENYKRILPLFNTIKIRADKPFEEVLKETLFVIKNISKGH